MNHKPNSINPSAANLVETGAATFTCPAVDGWVAFIRSEMNRIKLSHSELPSWQHLEPHNPWGRAATLLDSWKFLEICQSPELMDAFIAAGWGDAILFDSAILPNAFLTSADHSNWQEDTVFFPVDPLEGWVVRFPLEIGNYRNLVFHFRSSQEPAKDDAPPEELLRLTENTFVIHKASTNYRFESNDIAVTPLEFVIRYFPAASLYSRDPTHDAHSALTISYPLVNYLRKPLWLVQGSDKANNDFVTGFQPSSPHWTSAQADFLPN